MHQASCAVHLLRLTLALFLCSLNIRGARFNPLVIVPPGSYCRHWYRLLWLGQEGVQGRSAGPGGHVRRPCNVQKELETERHSVHSFYVCKAAPGVPGASLQCCSVVWGVLLGCCRFCFSSLGSLAGLLHSSCSIGLCWAVVVGEAEQSRSLH